MLELIIKVVFFSSAFGIIFILYRKIPALVVLTEETSAVRQPLMVKLGTKIKNISFFKSFSFEMLLQKILSKIKVLTLKTENRVSRWLEALRERAQKKKFYANDNYWKEVKEQAATVLTRTSRRRKKTKITAERINSIGTNNSDNPNIKE